ncbi:Gamma-glutamyl-hercynylcysteine sulfoxide hydrolase [compost metagenome]
MCRMLAKISVYPTTIVEEMLLCPTSLHYLSSQGRMPEDPETRGPHNDGCGIAYVNNKSIEIHKRDREHIWDNSYRLIIENVKSNLFIAHNRKATKDLEVNKDRSHPFYYQHFAFCHNGSVYSYMDEAQDKGLTDTEIFLHQLIDKSKNASPETIFTALSEIANTTNYSSLTAFLMGNDELFAWRIFNDKNHEKALRFEDYYTLWLKKTKDSVVIASEPLDHSDWEKLPNFSFLHFKPDGDSIHQFRKKIIGH